MLKLILLLSALMISAVCNAEVIGIISPINHQTVYSTNGNVKISFNVNATTLFQLPSHIILYIDGVAQKEIMYRQSSYFLINNMPEGVYTLQIGVSSHNDKIITLSPTRTFTISRKSFH